MVILYTTGISKEFTKPSFDKAQNSPKELDKLHLLYINTHRFKTSPQNKSMMERFVKVWMKRLH
jgi:hypothetical protein